MARMAVLASSRPRITSWMSRKKVRGDPRRSRTRAGASRSRRSAPRPWRTVRRVRMPPTRMIGAHEQDEAEDDAAPLRLLGPSRKLVLRHHHDHAPALAAGQGAVAREEGPSSRREASVALEVIVARGCRRLSSRERGGDLLGQVRGHDAQRVRRARRPGGRSETSRATRRPFSSQSTIRLGRPAPAPLQTIRSIVSVRRPTRSTPANCPRAVA